MFWPLRKPSSSVFGNSGPDRRRAARYDTTVLNCHLGEVLDLSATGLRVRCSGKPPLKQGDLTKITITSPSDGLYAAAMVAWIKRRGWKSFEMGLRFTDAKPALAYAAENMARFGFVRGAEAPKQSKPGVVVAKVEVVNHYSVLGVPYSASTQEIHAAFRLLARRCHPDVNRDPQAQALFVRINQAYEILKDPDKRKEYDAATGIRPAA